MSRALLFLLLSLITLGACNNEFTLPEEQEFDLLINQSDLQNLREFEDQYYEGLSEMVLNNLSPSKLDQKTVEHITSIDKSRLNLYRSISEKTGMSYAEIFKEVNRKSGLYIDDRSTNVKKRKRPTYDGPELGCFIDCNIAYAECLEPAQLEYDATMEFDCDPILVEAMIEVDVICTRQVVVGYNTVIVDGELVEIPIYETEEYVCGTTTVIDENSQAYQDYLDCQLQARVVYIEAWEACFIAYHNCISNCPGNVGPQ